MELEPAPDYLTDMMPHLKTRTVEQLRKLTINELPALHHLATISCKPEDDHKLDVIIKMFKNAKCDLNQKTDNYPVGGTHASLGFTSLLVAIVRDNLTFVKCLLRNGVRVDVSDQQGFLPLHWAVFMDDLVCFRLLIQAGALKTFLQDKRSDNVHPILHTAVDEGRTEMVTYLLETGLVDLNQEADYTGPHVPEHVRVRCDMLHQNPTMSFTPLQRALVMDTKPILDVLLKHCGKVTAFNELHKCILKGRVEFACMMVDRFSSQDLANDKIYCKWALFCLPKCAFLDDELINHTLKLIDAYVAAGWNLNSVGKSTFIRAIGDFEVDSYTKLSLLHLACYFRSNEIIKYLVKVGADLNLKTRGSAILNPLQVSILRQDWSSVEYLIANGADIHKVGGFVTVQYWNWISERNSRNTYLECHFTSIDLLLQLGEEKGLPALEKMLKKGVPPPEKIAFQRAVYGRNCEFVCKVVEHLCGVQKVTMENLTWLPLCNNKEVCVPALHWLIQNDRKRFRSSYDIRGDLAKVVDVMGRFGYDFSLVGEMKNGEIRRGPEEPLIFSILNIEKPHSLVKRYNLPLLETLLKFDKVAINVGNIRGMNPVNFAFRDWEIRWACDIGRFSDAVCLLIRSGVDVSGMTIGDGFKYYRGYLPMMQLLCSTGATIQPDLFVPSVAEDEKEVLATGIVNQEIEELKKWKEKFDSRHKFSLKHLCVLKIRGELETTCDLRRLYKESAELESVMEDVMFQFMNSHC